MNNFIMPIIALVGRPNVGKSTLFNLLTKSKDSLVLDQAGVTRDRQYGLGKEGSCPYWVIDTGGMLRQEQALDTDVDSQARVAISEADIIFFLSDAKDGLQPQDLDIIEYIRQQNKQFYLLVNKTDTGNVDLLMTEFYSLGVFDTHPISCINKRGIKELMKKSLASFTKDYIHYKSKQLETNQETWAENLNNLNLTIIGRPNAGKSTLINRMLGEQRVVASDIAGTTRDSISIPFEYEEQKYTLVDTAGVRKKSKVSKHLEKISVIKTLQAIEKSNVVLLMLDAHEGIGTLDAHLLGVVVETGKALVIAINKWDHLTEYEKDRRKDELSRKLQFVDFVKVHFISALHGTGIRDILDSAKIAYKSSFVNLQSSKLTQHLQYLQYKHQPALVRGYAVKMRYAHQGGKNPPIIVIHGSRLSHLTPSYLKYLEKGMRDKFGLYGTPIRFQLKEAKKNSN